MVGLGVVIYSYNMLGIRIYLGQTKPFFEVRSRNRITDVLGAKPPYLMESTTVTGSSTVLHMYQYTHLTKESLYIKLTY